MNRIFLFMFIIAGSALNSMGQVYQSHSLNQLKHPGEDFNYFLSESRYYQDSKHISEPNAYQTFTKEKSFMEYCSLKNEQPEEYFGQFGSNIFYRKNLQTLAAALATGSALGALSMVTYNVLHAEGIAKDFGSWIGVGLVIGFVWWIVEF